MEKISVKEILTHENPDLDAMLAILLLRRFGEDKFAGASDAPVSFTSAGKLPGGKTADELEKDGILAVDIGGGRFDTHPENNRVQQKKRERCAADLVAEAVGKLNDPYWTRLIQFVRLQDTKAQSLRSTDFIHHLTALPNIINGLQLMFDGDSSRILKEGTELIEAIPVYTQHKGEAVEEFSSLEIIRGMVERYLSEKKISIEKAPPAYTTFLEWRSRLLNKPKSAFSGIKFDEILSLPALVAGFWHQSDQDKEYVWQKLRLCFDAVMERETHWQNALSEFDERSHTEKINDTTLVSIASKNGMVIKAARFRAQADLIIYRDPHTGATSLLLNRRGSLKKFSMRNLAAKVRIAECIEEHSDPLYHKLYEPGMVHGWFLHQSENLLIRGSKKAEDFEPSRLSMDNLAGLARSEIDWQIKIPGDYCPEKSCLKQSCLFYKPNFATCKNHRNRHAGEGLSYTLADKLPPELLKKFKENK